MQVLGFRGISIQRQKNGHAGPNPAENKETAVLSVPEKSEQRTLAEIIYAV